MPLVQICLVNIHTPYEGLESALFKRGCVNGCCGGEVSMLWLALPDSPQTASVSVGGQSLFSVAGR